MLSLENRTCAHARGCNIVARTCPNDYSIMQHLCMKNLSIFKFESTTPNMLQHVATGWPNVQHAAINSVAICCVEMLGSFDRRLSIQQRTLVVLVKWPHV